MKEWIKKILQSTGIYHPLQLSYRQFLLWLELKSHQYRYKKFRGSGFCCNVCGEKFQKFVPSYPSKENAGALVKYDVIAGYGENIFCPHCMSTARERLLIGILADDIQLTKKKILHLSPEKNIFNFIKKEAEVVTADLEPGFYKSIDPKVQMHDITKLDYPDNSFDLIIGNHIMEHIPDDKGAMSELFRILKPGGQAIVQVPWSEKINSTIEDPLIHDPRRQSALFGQKDHVRIYSLTGYMERLKSAGFDVSVRPYSQLQQYYINAIQPGESFLHVKKPTS